MAEDDKEKEAKQFVDRDLERKRTKEECMARRNSAPAVIAGESPLTTKYRLLEAEAVAAVSRTRQTFTELDPVMQARVLNAMQDKVPDALKNQYEARVHDTFVNHLMAYRAEAEREFPDEGKTQERNDYIYAKLLQGQEDGAYSEKDVAAIQKLAGLPPLSARGIVQPTSGVGQKQTINASTNNRFVDHVNGETHALKNKKPSTPQQAWDPEKERLEKEILNKIAELEKGIKEFEARKAAAEQANAADRPIKKAVSQQKAQAEKTAAVPGLKTPESGPVGGKGHVPLQTFPDQEVKSATETIVFNTSAVASLSKASVQAKPNSADKGTESTRDSLDRAIKAGLKEVDFQQPAIPSQEELAAKRDFPHPEPLSDEDKKLRDQALAELRDKRNKPQAADDPNATYQPEKEQYYKGGTLVQDVGSDGIVQCEDNDKTLLPNQAKKIKEALQQSGALEMSSSQQAGEKVNDFKAENDVVKNENAHLKGDSVPPPQEGQNPTSLQEAADRLKNSLSESSLLSWSEDEESRPATPINKPPLPDIIGSKKGRQK